MIKHVCADCGGKFHLTESFVQHQCLDRCDGDCGHGEDCPKCLSGNPDLPCLDCIAEWRAAVDVTGEDVEWVGGR